MLSALAPDSSKPVAFPAPLGRAEEVARVCRILVDGSEGAGGALVVRGEPGIGKTTVLRAAAAAASDGMRIVWVRGVEAEAEIGYAGLADALRPTLGFLETLVPVQRAALESALALGPPAPTDALAVGSAALSLLAAAADAQPIAVLVDDLQFIDVPSQLVLSFVGRRLGVERIALVVSIRAGRPTPFDGGGFDELRLEPLDDEAAAAIVSANVPEIATAPRDQIVQTALGNPLALVELPTLLDRDQIEGRRPPDDPLRVNGTVHAAFAHQLASLSEKARQALLVVAADDTGDLDVVRSAIASLGLSDEGLEEVEREGVLVLGPPLRIRHPLLRSLVYHEAAAEEQRRTHAALADSVRDDAYRAAWHRGLAASGPDEATAEQLAEAAAAARARNLFPSAAAASDRAAALSPDPDERARRLVQAASDHQHSGAPALAASRIEEALRLSTAPDVRAEAFLLQGYALLFGGNPREACALLSRGAESIEATLPEGAALLLTLAVMACQVSAELREGTAIAQRAIEIAARASPRAQFAADLALAEMLLLRGDASTVRELQARAREIVSPDDPIMLGQLLQSEAAYLAFIGEHEAARITISQLVAASRGAGLPSLLPYPLAISAEIDYRIGRWPEALAHASEALEIAEQTRQGVFASYALTILGRIEAATGDERAAARLDRAEELAATLDLDAGRFFNPSARAFLALTNGRYEEAVAAGREVEAISAERGLDEPAVVLWAPDLIEAYVRVGRLGDARSLLERFEREATTTGRVWARAAAARCRSLIEEDFEERHAEATAWHDKIVMPFERARTELILGERRRRAGRRVDARAPLGSALATFERLGASPWAERARAGLRAAGARLPRVDPPALGELTAHELRVAIIVAGGATNREAAAELFVSPKTVDFHLQRIYRKLGITSRSQLARILAARES